MRLVLKTEDAVQLYGLKSSQSHAVDGVKQSSIEDDDYLWLWSVSVYEFISPKEFKKDKDSLFLALSYCATFDVLRLNLILFQWTTSERPVSS